MELSPRPDHRKKKMPFAQRNLRMPSDALDGSISPAARLTSWCQTKQASGEAIALGLRQKEEQGGDRGASGDCLLRVTSS